jgi:LDH2 family malate/lactate/ureidoglycolate dehydrogenase
VVRHLHVAPGPRAGLSGAADGRRVIGKVWDIQSGADEIRTPPERAFSQRAYNLKHGIEIDMKIYDALQSLPQAKLPELA